MKRKKSRKEIIKTRKQILIILIISLILSTIYFLINTNWISYALVFISINLFANLYIYARKVLKKSDKIKKMETVFPDFLQLMSSNLRAGMTIEKAMLSSSRPEFAPLDQEILRAGKDITTGENIQVALMNMAERIGSEKIKKTITLVISGIKAGGNLSVLLEQVSVNMREREYVEKKSSSNVLMYVIFIFIAVSIGAPVLFSLSSVLVEILTNLLGDLPQIETSSIAVPFSITSVNISISFIRWFSIIFIITLDILACLVIGLVNKGEEKQGLKYFIPIAVISLTIYFGARAFINNFMEGLF